jgi:hypothetical protein
MKNWRALHAQAAEALSDEDDTRRGWCTPAGVRSVPII